MNKDLFGQQVPDPQPPKLSTRRLNYLRKAVKVQEAAMPYLDQGIPIKRVWLDHIYSQFDIALDPFMVILRLNAKGELRKHGVNWEDVVR